MWKGGATMTGKDYSTASNVADRNHVHKGIPCHNGDIP